MVGYDCLFVCDEQCPHTFWFLIAPRQPNMTHNVNDERVRSIVEKEGEGTSTIAMHAHDTLLSMLW